MVPPGRPEQLDRLVPRALRALWARPDLLGPLDLWDLPVRLDPPGLRDPLGRLDLPALTVQWDQLDLRDPLGLPDRPAPPAPWDQQDRSGR